MEEYQSMVGKIAGGMFIVFLGLTANAFFRFMTRLLLARSLSLADYGAMTLGLLILEFTVMIGAMGLGAGTARFISFYRGTGEEGDIKGTVQASLTVCAVSSAVLTVFLFSAADLISAWFDNPDLAAVLRIFCIAVPFAVFIDLLAGIFRGFDRVEVRVFFKDLALYGLCTAAVLAAVLDHLGLSSTALLIAMAYVVAGLLLAAYSCRALPSQIGKARPSRVGRKLVLFSLPLALASLLNFVVLWTDTFMLGLLRGTEQVGTYNGAVPFANLLPIFLLSVIYIFLPVVTKSIAEERRKEVKALYGSATKWAFVLTLPLFFIFFLFSRQTVTFFIGARYEEAAVALSLLSLGLFAHVFLGPNEVTLVALGRTKLVLLDGAVVAAGNVILNYLLIPWMGIKGAATASAVSLFVGNLLRSLQVFHLAGIHPFSLSYLRPVVLSCLAGAASYPLFAWLVQGRDWLVVFLYPLYLVLVFGLILASRSVEEEDVWFITSLLGKLGLEGGSLTRFLDRFREGGKGKPGGPYGP